jgi:SpoVK/Ycf46/Vps4 family AAA+-type ATPase
MKSNIDDAFIRRFNSIVKFPFPEANERSAIWKKSFPEHVLFAKDVPQPEADATTELINIPDVVKKYELAGGSIINAVHYASLKAVERLNGEKTAGSNDIKKTPLVVYLPDVLQGIRKELTKEGKPFAV